MVLVSSQIVLKPLRMLSMLVEPLPMLSILGRLRNERSCELCFATLMAAASSWKMSRMNSISDEIQPHGSASKRMK